MTAAEIDTSPAVDCARCGYLLHDIADDQACPECGLLAGRSRRLTNALRDARPRWLRRIALGVCVLLAALLAPILYNILYGIYGNFIAMWFYRYARSWQLTYGYISVILPFIGYAIALLLLPLGAWLITTPEPQFESLPSEIRRRWLTRLITLLPLPTLVFIFWWESQYYFGYHARRQLMNGALVSAAIIICSPFPLLIFLQLRQIARRIGSAHLAEHCIIAGTGGMLTLAALSVILFVMSNANELGLKENFTTSSNTSLLMVLLLFTSLLLFLFWMFYLLIRFAIAFARTAREIKRIWKRDDRSLTTQH